MAKQKRKVPEVMEKKNKKLKKVSAEGPLLGPEAMPDGDGTGPQSDTSLPVICGCTSGRAVFQCFPLPTELTALRDHLVHQPCCMTPALKTFCFHKNHIPAGEGNHSENSGSGTCEKSECCGAEGEEAFADVDLAPCVQETHRPQGDSHQAPATRDSTALAQEWPLWEK
uniref:uncharacterized protein C7orf50 homolog isoform X8 n=1 Tax=Callithrix jacchus TaxID=9483 RepID=UPI0004F05D68|nr:uncharacterized protein C7orf50 homolog isoform X8 [Callithrix jacchus]